MTSSKLIKYEYRITISQAAEYFSDLIGEKVSADYFTELAAGSIPVWITPNIEEGFVTFEGFSKKQMEEILGAEIPAEDEGVFDISRPFSEVRNKGIKPIYIAESLPSPLHSDFDCDFTVTETGEQIYWLVVESTGSEMVHYSFIGANGFVTEMVSPKDVYDLARIAVDESCWPSFGRKFKTSATVNKMRADGKPGIEGKVEVFSMEQLPGRESLYELPLSRILGESEDKIEVEKRRPSHYLVISGLVEMLSREKNMNQDRIISELEERFDGIRGMKQSTLQKLFSSANKQLKAYDGN